MLELGQHPGELEHETSDPLVGDQQVRAGADDLDREALVRRPSQQPDQRLLGVGAREQLGVAAGPHGRQPGERIVALDSIRQPAHDDPRSGPDAAGGEAEEAPGVSRSASLLASSPMSPAPIVTSRSPSRRRPASARSAVAASRSQRTGLPPAVVGGRTGDVEPADAGERSLGSLARRVDVEHADLVGGGERGAEALGERLGPRVQVRLEDGDQPAGCELAQGGERRGHLGRVVRVVVVDLGARPASPVLLAPLDPGEVGERARRGLELDSGELERAERRAGVEQVVVAGHPKRELGLARASAAPKRALRGAAAAIG